MSELRTLPMSLDTEKALLACMFRMSVDAIASLPITSRCFWGHGTRLMFEEMLSVNADGLDQDLVLLVNRLRESGNLENMGPDNAGAGLCAEIYGLSGYTLSLVGEYCEQLQALAKRREAIDTMQRGLALAYDPGARIEETINSVQAKLAVAEEGADNDCVSAEVFSEFLKEIDSREAGKVQMGFMTGVPAWDQSTRGIPRGQMYLIGARPKVGKTAAIEIAIDTMTESGVPILLIQRDTNIRL